MFRFAALTLAFVTLTAGPAMAQGNGIDLTLTLQKGGPSQTQTIACPGTELCRLAMHLKRSDFDALPRRRGCAQIYGGPQVVRIQGQFKNRRIDMLVSRNNRCQTNQYNLLVGALAPSLLPTALPA